MRVGEWQASEGRPGSGSPPTARGPRAAAGVLAALLLAAPAARAQTTWTGELLTNPGFESGTTGWTNGGGGTLIAGASCTWCNDAPHGGSSQAYWEVSNAAYYAYQDVDLTAWASYIDAGTARVNATGWLISNEYQASPAYDQFRMQVLFYDGASTLLGGGYDSGTRNVEIWAQYGLTNAAIPASARRVRIWFNTWEQPYDAGSADDFSVQVGYPSADVSLTDHVAGQEGNKFTGASSVTGAELFAFQLANNAASSRTVSSLVLPISRVSGIAQADFASLETVVDANANGAIDAGETTTVGGVGVVNAGVTTITFSTAFPALGAGQTVRYILRGSVSGLAVSDFVTLSLGAANVTLASGTVAGAASDATHANGYAWRKPVTIDNAILGASCSADLTNYPVLVRVGSDSALRTVANGGHVQSANGYDIVFRTASGTSLDHEIEKYGAATGELVAWVRLPTLALAADTTIHAYYGNPAIVSPTENPAGVWDAGYAGVWHLEEAPAEGVAGHLDSTSPAQNGTPRGFADGGGGTTASSGIAAGADYFARETGTPGTFDHNRVEVPHDASLLPSGDMTVSAWVYLDAPSSGAKFVLYKRQDNSWYSYMLYFFTGLPRFQWSNTSYGESYAEGTAVPAANTWTHLTGVRRGTATEIWVDGVREGTGSGAAGTPFATNPNMISIGAVYEWDGSLGGRVDEVRISGVARSECWIQTDRNNEDPGSTGVVLGTEESGGDVLLSEHPAGQEGNTFITPGTVTGAELFAFQLTNAAASSRTVSALTLTLSDVAGIAQGHFANLQLVVDANANGTIDAGEATTVGGAGVVDAGVTSLAFSTAFPALGAGETVRYVLRGDVSSLGSGDRVTLTLAVGGVTLASGTVAGASPSPAVHALACCDLSTTEVADSTITVAAPNAFEMRFNAATGGGVDQFFDLAEDPARAYDLAGSVAGDVPALHNSGLSVAGPAYYNSARNDAGARLHLLEATPARVRVRNEAFYHHATLGPLAGVKSIGDYTVYPSGRMAHRSERRTTQPVTYLTEYHELVVHQTAAAPLDSWSVSSETDAVPSNPGSDAFFLAQKEAAGARTDFLEVIYEDWTAANGHVATADITAWTVSAGNERVNAYWDDLTGASLPANASEAWDFLTWFKPTNFASNGDAAVTARRTDYRTPGALTVSVGAGWNENTADADSFNESEAAYTLDLDPAAGLTFTMDGTTTRYSPFFKIRQWRSLTEAPVVRLNGTLLRKDVHYRAEGKPLSRAAFAQELLWHSTLQDGAAVATTPDVGNPGTVVGLAAGDFAAARYGNGARISGSGQYVGFPTADFDKAKGAVEFWYQPAYANTDGILHDICGFYLNASNLLSLEKRADNILYFRITANGRVTEVRATTARYSWRAYDWVHIRLDWDASLADISEQMRISVNGSRIPADISWANDYDSSLLSLASSFLFGNTNGDGDFAPGVYDEIHVYGSSQTTPTALAHGGLTSDSGEYLASASRNSQLAFAGVNATRQGRYLFLGTDSRFRGLNVALATAGTGVAAGALVWEYWNGATGAWTDLEGVGGFTDQTSSFTRSGSVYWTADPGSWATYSVNGGPDLYYVRAHLPTGSTYSVPPTERVVMTDILLFQYCGDIAAAAQQFAFSVPAPTAVGLLSFTAVPGDGSVTLEWRTGSELDNLGFHLYRGLSADGPWTRLTSSLIPGLGSSPLGQAYSWLDSGLVNGTTYYYRLEDVDSSSKSTFHGPVSAMPAADIAPPPDDGDPGDSGGGGDGTGGGEAGPGTPSCPSWVLAAAPDAVSPVCTRHGDPESVSLHLLSRDSSSATLELRTGGFWSLDDGSSTVRVFVPGLEFPSDPTAPALPLRRTLVEAVVGKGVEVVSADAFELRSFHDLRPSAVGAAEMRVEGDGTVRPARRALAAPLLTRGTVPREVARLAGTVFQGDRKSAVVEITPVRFSGSGLVLAGRVRVTLAFTGVVDGESGTGGWGRALPRKGFFGDVLARLHTSRRGLYAVRFEQLFPQGSRGLSTALLRLQRQGEAVAFHVEPPGPLFGPGSTLYFHAERTASSTDYSPEVAYELVRSSGVRMATVSAAPLGAPGGSPSTGLASFETNRTYQPGLLEAPDPWLWEYLPSGTSRRQSFALTGVATASGEAARLTVYLQGGSESGQAVDHHVEVSLNGVLVGETSFAGKRPQRVDVQVPASVLEEGANALEVVNVDDTGVASRVYLDRFEIAYPQVSLVRHGVFGGVWAEGATVEVGGLAGPPVILRESGLPAPEGSTVRWLTGFEATGASVRFQAEAGYRYLVVSPEGLLCPRVARVAPSTIRDRHNQADYLVIAPRELLEAASPLLERRKGQGLSSRGVAFEEIVSEFGHGRPSAEAIKAFLSYAYHVWQPPSPRYVLLLGDATDDPQRFQATSWPSPLPALFTRTSYLWTASDPALAAVNGEDALPDFAIGRLPARSREEAEVLVAKLLAWEESGQGLSGTAVLVADRPDAGGDFEADVEDVRASFLADRVTTTLRVGELGEASREAILGAFDAGASLMSYVGHGGTAVWSTSGAFASWDAPFLQAQSRQPVLLTMNCLNGYFVAPNLDALPEALLKAEGRGAVAAFSPSGLSLDGPAHEYHRALVAALASGEHDRLGDAILAAQRTYADSGLMPELLGVYQLLGDPAMPLDGGQER